MFQRVVLHLFVLALTFHSLVLAASLTAFIGTWVLNPVSRGVAVPVTKTSDHHYDFTGANGYIYHLVEDGQFHTELSTPDIQTAFQKTGDHEWTWQTKWQKPTPSHYTAIMTVEADGKTLTQKFERLSSDKPTHKSVYTLTRKQPGEGIEGDWIIQDYKVIEGQEPTMTFTSEDPHQLSLTQSGSQDVLMWKSLDGKRYPDQGPTALADELYALKLMDDHKLLYERFKNARSIETGEWTVSGDGQTFTMVQKPADKPSYTVSYTKR